MGKLVFLSVFHTSSHSLQILARKTGRIILKIWSLSSLTKKNNQYFFRSSIVYVILLFLNKFQHADHGLSSLNS